MIKAITIGLVAVLVVLLVAWVLNKVRLHNADKKARDSYTLSHRSTSGWSEVSNGGYRSSAAKRPVREEEDVEFVPVTPGYLYGAGMYDSDFDGVPNYADLTPHTNYEEDPVTESDVTESDVPSREDFTDTSSSSSESYSSTYDTPSYQDSGSTTSYDSGSSSSYDSGSSSYDSGSSSYDSGSSY